LYGKRLEIEVIDWIREQRKFGGIESLKARIDRDIATVREKSSVEAQRAIARADY
jgi:FAD synthase